MIVFAILLENDDVFKLSIYLDTYFFSYVGILLTRSVQASLLTLKGLGGGEVNLIPAFDFSKNVSFKETVKPSFFVTFNIILKHILPENFIELPQASQRI